MRSSLIVAAGLAGLLLGGTVGALFTLVLVATALRVGRLALRDPDLRQPRRGYTVLPSGA